MKSNTATDIATASARSIKTSPQKIGLILEMIRGKHITEALNFLENSQKRVAKEVGKVVQSAIANAENNHQLDIDQLYVSEAVAGRAFVLKRWSARARGKGARIFKTYSNLRIQLKERKE